MHPPIDPGALTEPRAWTLLRGLRHLANDGEVALRPHGVALDATDSVQLVGLGQGLVDIHPDATPSYQTQCPLLPEVAFLLDLYLPLCIGRDGQDLIVGHIGQSLDGQIATSTGASSYITGQEDLVHTHRLRALCDAVLVGRVTIDCDNPRLTTRLVAGDNPTRVIVDPCLRSLPKRHVFEDQAAPTLVLHAQGTPRGEAQYSHADLVEIPCASPLLPPALLLAQLRKRGLRRVLVEGGGATISQFLRAGLFHHLHVTVSPIFIGQGHPGVSLPGIDSLDQALRPRVRTFPLGPDTLFDCQFLLPPAGDR